MAEDFQYAVLRLVPDLPRGERINVGVVLFSRRHRFLEARVALDEQRVAALAPRLDLDEVRGHLDALARVAAGDERGGPVAQLEMSERFHWLVAPSSTIIQAGAVHSGLTDDPAATLGRLVGDLVHR